jgi:hypothetical protein
MRLRNAVLIPVVKHLEAIEQNGSTIKKDRLLGQQWLRCLHNLVCSSSHNVLHHRGATIGPMAAHVCVVGGAARDRLEHLAWRPRRGSDGLPELPDGAAPGTAANGPSAGCGSDQRRELMKR